MWILSVLSLSKRTDRVQTIQPCGLVKVTSQVNGAHTYKVIQMGWRKVIPFLASYLLTGLRGATSPRASISPLPLCLVHAVCSLLGENQERVDLGWDTW